MHLGRSTPRRAAPGEAITRCYGHRTPSSGPAFCVTTVSGVKEVRFGPTTATAPGVCGWPTILGCTMRVGSPAAGASRSRSGISGNHARAGGRATSRPVPRFDVTTRRRCARERTEEPPGGRRGVRPGRDVRVFLGRGRSEAVVDGPGESGAKRGPGDWHAASTTRLLRRQAGWGPRRRISGPACWPGRDGPHSPRVGGGAWPQRERLTFNSLGEGITGYTPVGRLAGGVAWSSRGRSG